MKIKQLSLDAGYDNAHSLMQAIIQAGSTVSYTAVKRWWDETSKPSARYIPTLCEVLGCSPSELYGMEGASA